MAGTLYVVATPIGNLNDISPRALEVLRRVDLIACEDTRHSQHLLGHYAIRQPLLALHQHNERANGEALLRRLEAGESVALISDAGTPLISDPGHSLTARALERGLRVVPVVGPSSVMAALSVAGLPADSFVFAGFIPSKAGERERFLADYRRETRTSVFFETPHRIAASLAALAVVLGPERLLVIGRELTKQFEEIVRLPLGEALSWLQADPNRNRGEFVLVLAGATTVAEHWEELARALRAEGLGAKTISALLAQHLGANKKAVYQYLLDRAD